MPRDSSSSSSDPSDSFPDVELPPITSPISPARARGESDDAVPALRSARTTFRAPRRSMTSHAFNPNSSRGRRWKPGEEPGLDPNALLPGGTPHLQTACDITFVQFSQDDFEISLYDNDSILELVDDMAKADGERCKWINVNGLSWDVISALARAKGFHPLAIEDVLSRKNRTKADWYSDHAYVVLPLQKLIHVEEGHKDEEESGKTGFFQTLFGRSKADPSDDSSLEKSATDPVRKYELGSSFAQLKHDDGNVLRTLQRYHGGQNEDRIEFMEEHRALKTKNLNVSVEQVSLFLTTDNTVVSFFEHSAEDIETPIITRLNSKSHTVLRRSNDSSLLLQALIDAIVDMALPVCTAYQDAIDELELNVLTSPQLQHTSSLYVLSSEVSQFRATLSPVMGLIDSLRDHSSPIAMHAMQSFDPNNPNQRPINLRHNTGNTSTVALSPAAKIYLADVADHVTVVLDSLEQIRRASDNMSSLIWNTIQAWQNESMRSLTNVTVLFLPLTFITGYFGQNFAYFDGVQLNSDLFFWEIALPVVFVIAVWVLRDGIFRWYKVQRQKFGIKTRRKKRNVKRE